jgi:hypothetical protein
LAFAPCVGINPRCVCGVCGSRAPAMARGMADGASSRSKTSESTLALEFISSTCILPSLGSIANEAGIRWPRMSCPSAPTLGGAPSARTRLRCKTRRGSPGRGPEAEGWGLLRRRLLVLPVMEPLAGVSRAAPDVASAAWSGSRLCGLLSSSAAPKELATPGSSLYSRPTCPTKVSPHGDSCARPVDMDFLAQMCEEDRRLQKAADLALGCPEELDDPHLCRGLE